MLGEHLRFWRPLQFEPGQHFQGVKTGACLITGTLPGIMPALKMHFRLCAESKPPSRFRSAPLRSNPTFLATFFKAVNPFGNRIMSVSLTGATGTGANT